MDEAKFSRPGVLDEFKWFLEPSWRGVYAYGKLPGIYNGMSSTALDLVSADIASQPDVSQPFVNRFGCGKVHNLGGRVTN